MEEIFNYSRDFINFVRDNREYFMMGVCALLGIGSYTMGASLKKSLKTLDDKIESKYFQ